MKRVLIALLLTLLPGLACAQVDIGGPSIFVSVSPTYPQPGQAVIYTVQSPLIDLSARSITWKNAGTVVQDGVGETTYKTNAPQGGEHDDIAVSVEGVNEPATISVTPSDVDLLWESQSYAPGLYLGRHLPSQGSNVVFQALPHLSKNGSEIPAAQLLYVWKVAGDTVAAGRGKSSVTVPIQTFSDSFTVSVEVSNADHTLGAGKSQTFSIVEPTVRLYFEHPLYGTLYHMALAPRTDIADTEMSFAAIPYFAGASGAADPLFSYIWRVNGTQVQENDSRPNVLTINSGSGGGEAQVELSLTHKKNFRFDAHGAWNVVFGSIAAHAVANKAGPDLFGTGN